MNHKQRILTYISLAVFALSFLLVPWRVSDPQGGHYELSAYWQPMIYDEGGVERPVLLYVEWGVLSSVYAVLLVCLRNRKNVITDCF
jgi:hypothetical protein